MIESSKNHHVSVQCLFSFTHWDLKHLAWVPQTWSWSPQVICYGYRTALFSFRPFLSLFVQSSIQFVFLARSSFGLILFSALQLCLQLKFQHFLRLSLVGCLRLLLDSGGKIWDFCAPQGLQSHQGSRCARSTVTGAFWNAQRDAWWFTLKGLDEHCWRALIPKIASLPIWCIRQIWNLSFIDQVRRHQRSTSCEH